ncbi:MAG: zf-HC2 domain-containing protein [Pseudomonadota bacterium]|nr:zf-HC2 domain-containing protein [Pseudomonadota bacterium]
MQCAESLRVQAYFDGEVDAVSAAEIERHVEHCAECRALLQDLEQVRTRLRRDVSYEGAPPQLRSQIMRTLDLEAAGVSDIAAPPQTSQPIARNSPLRRGRSFWSAIAGSIGGAALAAAVAVFLVIPRMDSSISREIVSAHVRSLMPSHLIDVASTDKHTVKPWFAGHADVSPVVADFESHGFRLIGGRADYLDHQRAAVVVYQHGPHVINLFSWIGTDRLPGNSTRSGYHLAFWSQGDIQYCAVSDTSWDELFGLVRLLREQA